MNVNLMIEPIQIKDLKEGDLFSVSDMATWGENLACDYIVGHKVYIRTSNPCLTDNANYNPDQIVFKITINQPKGSNNNEKSS
jgi:hypothetical protein